MTAELAPDVGNTLLREIMEVLINKGTEGFRPVLEALLNETMKIDREMHLRAAPYERTDQRRGQANGFKPKTLSTRLGPLQLEVPQVRDSSFYPQSLERGCRSEVALKVALAEMYTQGVSTRKVTAITEKLCGTTISSTQVSNIAKTLDSELEKFRKRQLSEAFRYVFLDAQYQQVRHAGAVRSLAVLLAIGINSEGKREILGVSVSLSEAEVHWREFLQSLLARGLSGMELVISDDHSGLKAARQAVMPSVPWQRCQFHMSQNAQAYVPVVSMRQEIAQAMRDIFSQPGVEDAREMAKKVIKRYEKKAPKFAKWLEENIEEGFAVFKLPRELWRKLRTSNGLERLNREIKRRTRVATLFPNEASCLRLITAVLQEINEEWVTGRSYIGTPKLG
jgi:transposase-like protein